MPEVDGEVLYQVRADTSELPKDLDKANSDAEKGASKLKDIASGTAKAVGASFVAVAGSAAAVGAYAVNAANDMDKAMNSFIASTGTAAEETERYQNVLENIYANNYGDDFQDIADSMAVVQKNIDGLSDEQLQQLTESAFALRDTFEYDIAESTRAAKSIMDNFGVSGEEAMNLIAAGAQNGLDFSGELIDSINEYSVQFGKLGFTADDMFKVFQQGADSGAFNLDKVGDAIKEFSIRAIDGSDSTIAGFTAIGLNADDMAARFAKGGDSAKAAFQETLNAISSIKDPLEKEAAGVALFGTMWEDLGPEAVEALAGIEDGAYDAGDALNEIKEVKYNDLSSMLEGLKRSVELLVIPLGEMLIPVLTEIIQDVLPILQEQLPVLIESFSNFLPPLMQMAQELLPVIIELITQLMPIITQMMSEILPVLLEAVQALLPVFMQVIQELLPPLIDLFTQLMPVIMELATSLIPPLVAVFEALMPPLLELIDILLPPLIQLINNLMPLIEALTPIIEALALMFSDVLKKAIELVTPIIESVMDILNDIIDFLINVFEGNWEGAWNSIVEVFKGIFNLIPQAVEAAINGAIGIINKLIGGINDITEEVGINAIPTIGEVSLPRFHTGGIIDFNGYSEVPILAKPGEMVLTEAQQRKLFDIANGLYYSSPQLYHNNSNSNHKQINFYNNQTYYVRDDNDIEQISEDMDALERRISAGKGE